MSDDDNEDEEEEALVMRAPKKTKTSKPELKQTQQLATITCTKCKNSYANENEEEQRSWRSCERNTCTKWVCRVCLPKKLKINDEYYCSVYCKKKC